MPEQEHPVRFAVPKGSLQKATAAFLQRAGLALDGYGEGSRNYRPSIGIDGVVVKVLRPQEIPMLVAEGLYDLGISGRDWYVESNCQRSVADLVDLGFGKVDIVLAVPQAWQDVNSAEELFRKFIRSTSKDPLRIWTEYLNIADEFVFQYQQSDPTVISPYAGLHRNRHSGIRIYHSFGATESKPPEDGEAIIDNTQTGRTLQANGLKIIHKVLPASTARLLGNRRALLDEAKRQRIDRVVKACQGASPVKTQRKRPLNGHLNW
jgi:ATP phosphoribosyltransferase